MPHRAVLALSIFVLTACEGAANGLLFGGNAPEETSASREVCRSAAESPANPRTLFAAWDDTGDGLLSYNEFNDCIGPKAQTADLFAAIDANGDRMIDPAEFSGPALPAIRDPASSVR